MTVRYEPHRVTGRNHLAAVCDTDSCDQSLYVDGVEQLRTLGWYAESHPSPGYPRPARCPAHAVQEVALTLDIHRDRDREPDRPERETQLDALVDHAPDRPDAPSIGFRTIEEAS
jgi:hypothetical protein